MLFGFFDELGAALEFLERLINVNVFARKPLVDLIELLKRLFEIEVLLCHDETVLLRYHVHAIVQWI